jgi:hypothetical protein
LLQQQSLPFSPPFALSEEAFNRFLAHSQTPRNWNTENLLAAVGDLLREREKKNLFGGKKQRNKQRTISHNIPIFFF